MSALQNLFIKDNTVLVIKHNMDVIKFADYVINLGPEIAKGGTIVVKGTPEQVSKNRASYTDKFLLEELR
jgi:excinuclease ABC subunit A